MTGPDPQSPKVTLERSLEWPDTDASGHQHHSVVLRWVEEAEAALLRERGLAELFGYTPRVRYQVDYRSRLWFGDRVEVRLAVVRIGRSSLTYGFRVSSARGAIVEGGTATEGETATEGGIVAEGEITVVHTATNTGGSAPWPERVRAALTGREMSS